MPSLPNTQAPLHRGEGLSAWRQIADVLEAEIADALWPAGRQLPTEAELAARFGVNRHTVRRSLAALAGRGLVRASQGRGTYVEDAPLAYPIGSRTRFSEIVAQAGREAWGDLLDAAIRAADDGLAEALQVQPGSEVLRLLTVHRADGTPISLARTTVPLPRFAGLDRAYAETGSLSRAYAAYGTADYRRLTTRISARLATADEARLLELAPGRVVLVADSVNVDTDGIRIQATRACFAAERVEFVIES